MNTRPNVAREQDGAADGGVVARWGSDLRTATLLAAAVLVVGVVAAVLLFAIPRPPTLPAVSDDHPAPTDGRVAWTRWGDEGRCVHVLHPDGRVDRDCELDLDGELQGWEEGRLVVQRYDGGRQQVVTIDPDTGERSTRTGPAGHAAPARIDLRTDHDDGQLEVRVDGRVVWTVEADPAYDVRWAVRSDDGTHVLLLDRADRLLVLPADGSQPPRVWTEDLPSYGGVVWEAAEHAG